MGARGAYLFPRGWTDSLPPALLDLIRRLVAPPSQFVLMLLDESLQRRLQKQSLTETRRTPDSNIDSQPGLDQKGNLDTPLDGVTRSSPFIGATPPSGSPLTGGGSAAWSWLSSGAPGGGVEWEGVLLVRSGMLAAGDGELWGSGVGVRSDRGEPDRRLPGTGEGFCWGRRRRSISCS